MVEWSKDLYVNPNLQANLGEQSLLGDLILIPEQLSKTLI